MANDFEPWLASHLANESRDLARDWLQALRQRLPEHPRRIFPDDTLLNHIPELLQSLFWAAAEGEIPSHPSVRKELRTLAGLRRAQGYDVEEIVEEFELLSEVIFARAASLVDEYPENVTPRRVLETTAKLQNTLHVLARHTTHEFRKSDTRDRVERSALLSSFGRSVSHELRNRLNAAMLRVGLAREMGENALDGLEETLRRVGSVVDDVFAVAVATDEARAETAAVLPLDSLVAQVLADLMPAARERSVELRTVGTMPGFHVDATRLQLVFINLLTNAIKYCDPDKPERWVEIHAEKLPRGREWRIDVKDNGLGVPPELKEEIFEPSVRADQTQPGEGLGLALARRAVEQLSGRIWVTSHLKQGSVFAFTVNEPRNGID